MTTCGDDAYNEDVQKMMPKELGEIHWGDIWQYIRNIGGDVEAVLVENLPKLF